MIEAARGRLARRFPPSVLDPWLAGLPALVADLAAAWDLQDLQPLDAGGTSLVLRCGPSVLKLTPDRALVVAEASALRAWAATGAVPEMRAFDDRAGALLLEWIDAVDPVSAGTRPHDLLARLHAVPPPAGTPSLRDRVAFVWDFWTPRVAGMADTRAAGLALADGYDGEPVLLHGDLHLGNVIGAERGLVAIDPRPCVGDPAFDAVDWPTVRGARVTAWREVFAPLLSRS